VFTRVLHWTSSKRSCHCSCRYQVQQQQSRTGTSDPLIKAVQNNWLIVEFRTFLAIMQCVATWSLGGDASSACGNAATSHMCREQKQPSTWRLIPAPGPRMQSRETTTGS
jgi:hypothetical protein